MSNIEMFVHFEFQSFTKQYIQTLRSEEVKKLLNSDIRIFIISYGGTMKLSDTMTMLL